MEYFYQPHKAIQIRSFSDYIEEGDSLNVVGIPDYSYYSTTNALFRWRDLYPYGFTDTDGIGVDYPYLNDAHYPFSQILFLQSTPYSNINQSIAVTAQPIKDLCE